MISTYGISLQMSLYVLTSFTLFSIKIDFEQLQDKPELKAKVYKEGFLPKKLSKVTFCLLPSNSVFLTFGGI